jgi:hypothetical protein
MNSRGSESSEEDFDYYIGKSINGSKPVRVIVIVSGVKLFFYDKEDYQQMRCWLDHSNLNYTVYDYEQWCKRSLISLPGSANC